MGDTIVPKNTTDITEAAMKSIVGWIGRHALPQTLACPSSEYTTALALDTAVTGVAARMQVRLPVGDGDQAVGSAVRDDWNLLVAVARAWSNEPDYPGWDVLSYP